MLDFTNHELLFASNAVLRSSLDYDEFAGVHKTPSFDSLAPIRFVSIRGINDFWKTEQINYCQLMQQVLSGMAGGDSAIAFILSGSLRGIQLRIGVKPEQYNALTAVLRATYQGIELVEANVSDLRRFEHLYGGVMVGRPSGNDDHSNIAPEDKLNKLAGGMLGSEFIYMVLARGISTALANDAHSRALQALQSTSSQVRRSVTGGHLGNETIQIVDFFAQEYLSNLRILEKSLNDGNNLGLWRSCVYYAVTSRDDYQRMVNMLKMVFGGILSKPERIRCIQVMNIGEAISNLMMMDDIDPDNSYHPIGILYAYRWQTVLDSGRLSLLVNLPANELPGFCINQSLSFDTATRMLSNDAASVFLGRIVQSSSSENDQLINPYQIPLDDLNRHGLIIGMTGGGKTNTAKHLLRELWIEHKTPFLVIESAKREYWEMLDEDCFSQMMLFTLGSEEPGKSIRYRINPFEVIGDVALQTHIDYLLSTFKAAFELFPPMPYVLETAVYEVYEDRGWDIVSNKNSLGLKDYPNLTDLYRKIDIVTDRLGYHTEAKENTKAALKARINSLRIGGKGAMMDTRKSIPIQTLLSGPVVLELEDLGDDDTKAFVIGLLLVQLYEYRKSQLFESQTEKKLHHVVLIEEAHRLLKRVSEVGEAANPRAKAVEFFCNLLAEIRAFGQGFLIADQIPTKLASDTIKNTNLKIVHRIVMEEDRQAVGKAMNMLDEQLEALSSLQRGYAAVYAEGDNRPKMVYVPLFSQQHSFSRQKAIEKFQQSLDKSIGHYVLRHDHHLACTYCEEPCQWRATVLEKLRDKNYVIHILTLLNDSDFSIERVNTVVLDVLKSCPEQSFFVQICILGHLLAFSTLPANKQSNIISNYIRLDKRSKYGRI